MKMKARKKRKSKLRLHAHESGNPESPVPYSLDLNKPPPVTDLLESETSVQHQLEPLDSSLNAEYQLAKEPQNSSSSSPNVGVYQANIPHLYEVTSLDLHASSTLESYSLFRSQVITSGLEFFEEGEFWDAKVLLGTHEVKELNLYHSLAGFCAGLADPTRLLAKDWKCQLDDVIKSHLMKYIKVVLLHIRVINYTYSPPLFQADKLAQVQRAVFTDLKSFFSAVFQKPINEEEIQVTNLGQAQKAYWSDSHVNSIRKDFIRGQNRQTHHRLAATWILTELWMKIKLNPLYQFFLNEDGKLMTSFKVLINDKIRGQLQTSSVALALDKFHLRIPPDLLSLKWILRIQAPQHKRAHPQSTMGQLEPSMQNAFETDLQGNSHRKPGKRRRKHISYGPNPAETLELPK
ncbi:hypothetical protein O181_041572 [Austropuccinia psidii MF-1]|uniref:Uncharacterized protein n=1 Tax=Austropuccinia psidii MF-1 TaxID=1389203 RepID=A0A9Q3DL16_9BASI|nr:hypothetical protein [Austropuccinia psidii MF-1]